MNKNSIFWGIFHSILCSVLFGLSFLFTKQAVQNYSILTLLGWRFLIAALCMTLLWAVGWIKIEYRGKDLFKLTKLVLLYPVLYFIGETLGVLHSTSSEAGVIINVIPLTTLLASFVILKEKPLRNQVIGILVTTVGIFLSIFASSVDASFSLFGYIMLFVAVASYSLYAVFVIRAPEFSIMEKTYFMMLIGALFFFGGGLIEQTLQHNLHVFFSAPFKDMGFLTSVLYLAIGSSVIAFFSSNYALEALGANRSVSYSGLTTVISIIAGVVALKEPFGPLKTIAAILIIGGVYVANMDIKKEDLT
ncbi:DMT family transporter [Guggenheimella bovis]